MIDRKQLDRILARIPELEAGLSDPAVAGDQKRYRVLAQEHADLKRLEAAAREWMRLSDRIAENRVLMTDGAEPELAALAAQELPELEAVLPAAERALRLALLPPDPDADRNVVMEIRAGTGGDEAGLFAGDLYRMYSRYAETRGWKVSPIDANASETGGYKEIIFSVEGAGVYGVLRYEMGGHRVQRVPVTESQGRIHTSAATVAVFPEAAEEDELEIGPEDIRIDIFRASGAGGQHVNTTDSAVRITHLETGIVVQSQDERSQHRNRDKAMSVLRARILDRQREAEARKKGDARRVQIGSGDRSERIRTYNFPQNRLTDHRIGLTLYSLDRIIQGELGELLAAVAEHDLELRMQAGLAGGAVS